MPCVEETKEEVEPEQIRNLNENFSNLKVRVASPKGGRLSKPKQVDDLDIDGPSDSSPRPQVYTNSNNQFKNIKNLNASKGAKRF